MRRLVLVLVVVPIVLASAGCFPYDEPMGPPPLRYRDAMFSDLDITSKVLYGRAPNQQGTQVGLRLDVYQPGGDLNTRRPAIVFVHGGGFTTGDRLSGDVVSEARMFARRGYVTVSIDYRLYNGFCLLTSLTPACTQAVVDATHDAQAAVRFLRAEATTYGVDPDRIAIAGTSAGAVVALDVAFSPEDPGSSGHKGYSSSVRAAVAWSGAHMFGTIDPGDAPTLLLHGTEDTVVPYSWAVATVDDAHAAGLDSTLETWVGEGHVPLTRFDEVVDKTMKFLYAEMDLAHAAT